ncbi:anthranilate synthase component I [Bacillus sp. Gen3]|nr:anthranilate synthase component I [Bacillus sp. Gen3]
MKITGYKIEHINADTLTPIAVFNRIQGRKKFLLESSLKHEENGRYSFIGMNPYMEFIARGSQVAIINQQKEVMKEETGKPLELLKKYIPGEELSILNIPFIGGAVGYIGYDAIREYENIGEVINDEVDMPDIHFMFYQDILVFDHLAQTISIIALNLNESRTDQELVKSITDLKAFITDSHSELAFELEASNVSFTPLMKKAEFMKLVEVAKEHILQGDIFQLVLSQRMIGNIDHDSFQFYRKLRNANPSPYMFYLDFEDYVVLGASPESLIKTKGKQLITNPIAGTRPRGNTKAHDQTLENELLSDEKELAEHQMLVDLSRNDIGKICEPGSISIPKYMMVERYQHVMHIVSEVKGTMRAEFSGIDALIACLPAGTVSGAPKIRAMQIINDLEKRKRGVYAGAIGYINVNGDLDFALAIRTLVIKNGKAILQAGAGIVYDSDPEKEYEETLNKAKSLLEVNNHDYLARQL